MGRRTLLIINRDKADAETAGKTLRGLIERHGTLVDELDSNGSDVAAAGESVDLVVVVGGDGTLLSQSRRCLHLDVPILGINAGKLGFMAAFDLDSAEAQGATLFGGGALKERVHHPLRVVVRREGDAVFEGLGLNEAVVTAGPPYRMIELSVRIDGRDGPTVSGDGMIVSTALGSTAYNLSAGGPILSPEAKAWALTPIAAHSLAFRPIVLSDDSALELRLNRTNEIDGEPGTTLVMDGQGMFGLRDRDEVRIERHPAGVRFVLNPEVSFWSTAIEKLHWAAKPKYRRSDTGSDSGTRTD